MCSERTGQRPEVVEVPREEVVAPSQGVAVVEAEFQVAVGLVRLEVVARVPVLLEGVVGAPMVAEGCLHPAHPPQEPVGAGPPPSCTFGGSH